MDRAMLDIYVDYLICSTSYTTATGLAKATDNRISHDKVTRFLSAEDYTGRDLWQVAKPLVKAIESEDGVLVVDDTIEEKPYTDENPYVAYHHDHKKNRCIKGINFLSALYVSQNHSVPVGFSIVQKTQEIIKKNGKKSRKDPVTKQQRFRELLYNAVQNGINFKYALTDTWFSSVENMDYIKLKLNKHFITPLKDNRKVALSEEDKKTGTFVKIKDLDLEKGIDVWLDDLSFPIRLVRVIFKNEDESVGILYLATSNLELTDNQVSTIYQKRWSVETYHKSLKSNASLAKSPTKTPRTQANHLFASICAFIKLERISIPIARNHFSIKDQIYIRGLKAAWLELNKVIQTAYCPAGSA
jgi:hypothetical protein